MVVIIGMRGKPSAAEASMTLQQPEMCRVFSQGSCPWITGILDGCSSCVSLSCLSLLSVLIAVARPHLWSSFRQCSTFCGQTEKGSPLLAHPETVVSCLLGRSRVFSGLPPG